MLTLSTITGLGSAVLDKVGVQWKLPQYMIRLSYLFPHVGRSSTWFKALHWLSQNFQSPDNKESCDFYFTLNLANYVAVLAWIIHFKTSTRKSWQKQDQKAAFPKHRNLCTLLRRIPEMKN